MPHVISIRGGIADTAEAVILPHDDGEPLKLRAAPGESVAAFLERARRQAEGAAFLVLGGLPT